MRHAPWSWNVKLDITLTELGFTKCALYTRQQGKEHLIVGVYVDDLIIISARQ